MGEDVEGARRAGPSEVGQTDEDVAQRLVGEHLLEYFEASEEQRAEVSRDIEAAEARGEDLLAAHLPWGEWLHKWPLAARNAIRALWRTPVSVVGAALSREASLTQYRLGEGAMAPAPDARFFRP